MATAPSMAKAAPASQAGEHIGADQAAAPLAEQPVASLSPGEKEAPLALSGTAVRLPVELDVSIQVRGFRVRHLLALEAGQIVETAWIHGEDVPLAAGEVLLAWSEFEVVDNQLAVRITRLP